MYVCHLGNFLCAVLLCLVYYVLGAATFLLSLEHGIVFSLVCVSVDLLLFACYCLRTVPWHCGGGRARSAKTPDNFT